MNGDNRGGQAKKNNVSVVYFKFAREEIGERNIRKYRKMLRLI